MEDHNRMHFPPPKIDLTGALGVIEDMMEGQVVPDSTGRTDRENPPIIFGAGGPMLKQFDQSAASSRKGSQAPTPPRSVVGIGNKGNRNSLPALVHGSYQPYPVAKPDYSEAKIVLAMVGLPARGKSYLSNKLTRYLKWLEYDVQVCQHSRSHIFRLIPSRGI
ncbi:hypothetical protein M404DRAFT_36472 [Pisolithus tinctorius Marx 270]|uniref:6-phosphofructo-2-kinase domain-containing protein n=1 Tax=Pisolithus tinctorius Marx 270 TaxID=870435 RepID=A0A0C3I764_PISTI|nr:hypothetical protein M404DRAFT_36472 [Pisolithus tinctorius Marx 270]